MTQDRPITAALAAAALAAVIGVYALTGTTKMSALGSVFPITAAVVLLVCATLLLLRTWWRSRRSVAPADRSATDSSATGSAARFIGTGAVLLAWALLLKPLGFLLTSAVGCALLVLLVRRERMGPRSILLHAVAGIIIIGGFYLLMVEVLRLSVPTLL